MELLLVIVGVVLLWKFASALNGLAKSAEVKAQVMSEEVISEAVVERTKIAKKFVEKTKEDKVLSHEDMMDLFGVKK